MANSPLSRPAEILALERLGWFREASWRAWWVALRALLADPLAAQDGPEPLQLYTQCTGRTTWPQQRTREAWFICGRRSGKTLTMAKLAVTLAAFTDVRRYLAPGEPAVVMLLAADRRQARIAKRYIEGLFLSDPALARLLRGDPTRESLALENGVVIEIHTSDYRAVRGYTLLCVIADETAFWSREHRANPDTEIITAVQPGLATIPTSLFCGISTPHARRGAVYQAFTDHYAKDGDPVLVWRAPTRWMNPLVSEDTLTAALNADPSAARAEWWAEFRSDLESYVSREVLEAVIERGCAERGPVAGIEYVAFVDPAGSGNENADSMPLAIAHAEWDAASDRLLSVLDLVLEVRPPFNPDEVVGTFAELMKRYGIRWVAGDKYGGTWPAARFAAYGLEYVPAARTKSECYKELLPLLTAGRARLLDAPRLRDQLLSLERHVSRGGRDVIDHPPGGHDDVSNAVAGALLLAGEAGAGAPEADTAVSPGEYAAIRAAFPGLSLPPWAAWAEADNVVEPDWDV